MTYEISKIDFKHNFEDKKKNFGITLTPEIYKLLDIKAQESGKSRYEIIEEIMEDHFKNKNRNENK